MKILFAIPKVKSLLGGKSLTINPHVGIAYLSSFLKKNGVEVRVFDDGIENNHHKLLSTIKGFNPDIIGVSVFSYCYKYACDLIKVIKDNYKIPLVLGGAHVNIIKEKILLDTGAEFAIKHEGEYSLLELLKELETKGNNFKGIKGLIWRHADGIVENPDRPWIEDLDSLPFPEYDIFDIKKYFFYQDRILPIITSRGCPYACNFCSVNSVMGREFRPRSAKNVVEEIEYFVQKGWKSFAVNDDCFTLDIDRAEEICDLILQKKIDITFQLLNGIRVDRVTPRLLKKMKLAGCIYVAYGCESGSDKILKIIQKGITTEQVRKAVSWANEAGIPNSVNFIIGHTQETYSNALETINFAKSLPTGFTIFHNLLPYPGTKAYVWAQEHGKFFISPKYYLENILSHHGQPIFETDDFTKKQREEVVALGFNLYKRKYLKFRFGNVFGSIIYYITKIKLVDKFAAFLVLDTRFGKSIYITLCKIARALKGKT